MVNKIILQGRFTKDIELRSTNNGTSFARGTLAVERDRKENGEKVSDFIDCVFWGKTAEFAANWFGKGKMAIVTGRLQNNKWQDKTGNTRDGWEVNGESLNFCGDKNDSEKKAKEPESDFIAADDVSPDDVPF